MALLNKDSSVHIQKLTENNYAVWKFKLEMLLTKEDLFDVIENETPAQPTAEWKKRDRHARALINLHIDDRQIIHVKHEISAKSTWEKLRVIHERSNLSSKLFLLRKLYGMKLENDGNMEQHIVSLLELIDRLRAIGEDIKEAHISALLLCSLPQSYENLVTALEARNEDELTPDFIKGKLIDEYNRRLESNKNSKHSSVAYKSMHTKRNIDRERKYCSHCRMSNHNNRECFYLNGKRNNNASYMNKNSSQRAKNTAPQKTFSPKQSSNFCDGDEQSKERGNGRHFAAALSVYDQRKTNEKAISLCGQEKGSFESPNEMFLEEINLTENENQDNLFYVDSGASRSMSSNINFFSYLDTDARCDVLIANGKTIQAKGTGEGYIDVRNSNGEKVTIKIEEVLFVPELKSQLLSVRAMTKRGASVLFEGNKCTISKSDRILAEAYSEDSLYKLKIHDHNETKSANFTEIKCQNENCIQLWHRRLGHRNFDSIRQLTKEDLANGIKLCNCKTNIACPPCIKGKMSEKSFPKSAKNRATAILDLVHSDLCGPLESPTISGKRYLVTFVDDYSRFTMVYLIEKKDEFISKLKEYVAVTNNKFGKIMTALRSDNGGEYISSAVEEYLVQHGIQRQLTIPHCPSQNGVAERKNRSLMEMTRCLLLDANLANRFWGEAVLTATYIQNRLPTKANLKTPYEMWTGHKPDLQNIKTFGCKAYAYIPKHKRKKLDDKAIEGIFLGYDNRSKGYRIYINDKNVIISRTVKFVENLQAKSIEEESSILTLPYTQAEDIEPKIEEEEKENKIEVESQDSKSNENNEPRRSERTNKGIPPDRLAYKVETQHIQEPKTWNEIQEMPESEKRHWIKASEEEIKSLEENNTWTLVDLPQGKKPIGCKWTYKVKYNSKGQIDRYKARLVAKGFSQKYGTDYEETFAPVVKHTTIRLFLTAAVYKDMYVEHIDVKTAFLNGDINEELYMTQPEGFIKQGKENKVCKLNKSIYGLKQAARAWNQKIGETLLKHGFKQSKADPCLFTFNHHEKTIYIILYVDDILISSAKKENIQEIVRILQSEYEIKSLGQATYYLGINIEKDENGCIALSQTNKIQEIIEKFNMTEAKPTNTPMETNYYNITGEEDLLPTNTKYRQAVGALLYVATITRPDIAAAVNILSRRNENPRERDWNAVKRVIRYLKTTKNIKLILSKDEEPILSAHADADWANDKNDRKSTSGNVFRIGSNTIHWISKKQNCVALSSTEAEYVSAASAAQEILWLQKLLEDIGLNQKLPTVLYEDNQSCIKLTNNEKGNNRTKHIDIKHHCLRDLTEKGVIDLQYCPTKDMIADTLTKPLPKSDFIRHRGTLQLRELETLMSK